MKKATIYRLQGADFGTQRWVKHTVWEGETVDVIAESHGRFTVIKKGGGRTELGKYSESIFAFALETVTEEEMEPNDAHHLHRV